MIAVQQHHIDCAVSLIQSARYSFSRIRCVLIWIDAGIVIVAQVRVDIIGHIGACMRSWTALYNAFASPPQP